MTKDERALMQSVSARLDQIHEALYGNGDPTHSMMASQVRQEAEIAVAAKAAKKAAEMTESLDDKMDAVAASVHAHLAKVHLFDIVKNPKAWGYILIALVLVNAATNIANPWVLALIKAWTGIAIP